MKQTAVEFLLDNLDEQKSHRQWVILINDALEMEKQQIVEAWVDGNDNEPKIFTEDFAEKYYKEKFKK